MLKYGEPTTGYRFFSEKLLTRTTFGEDPTKVERFL